MIEDYLLFARTVALGSISAAARELRLSPAMISRRLARFEERLGARLINRSTRHLQLTDLGEAFHERVVAILAASMEAERLVADRSRRPAGRLRISSGALTGRLCISPHIGSFLRAYPDVQIELDLNDDFVDLRRQDFDLAIRITDEIEPHLVGDLLTLNPRILCCSPDYIARRGTPHTLADLKHHDLLGATTQFPWKLEGPDGPTRVYGESVVRTNSSEVIRDLLLDGLGIARRSPWDVPGAFEDGRLVQVLPEYRGSSRVGIYAVHTRSIFVPPAVTAFIAHLKAIFATNGIVGALRVTPLDATLLTA